MDNLEIILMSVNSDEEIQYGLLAFTGIIENPVYALALGDEDTVYKLQENGKLKFKKDLE
jgi:hypothetical protein